MIKIIDGKAISKEIKDEVKEAVNGLKEQGITVSLAVIQVGNDPASGVYVGNKKKACEYCGIESVSYILAQPPIPLSKSTAEIMLPSRP